MALLDRLKGLFKRSKGSSLIYNVSTPEVFTDIDSEKAITEGFNANTAVYSIVMYDAVKFGSIPRYVYQSKRMQEKAFNEASVVENDLSVLLNRPNEYQGQDAFFTITRAYFKTCGEAFIWLNRGDATKYDEATDSVIDLTDQEYEKKPVLEMYCLPSNKVIIRPDPLNLWGVIGYLLDVDGKYIGLRKCDIIHWKMPNMDFDPVLRTHLRGMAPLTAGYKSLQQNNDATDASVRMFQNDGAKGVLTNESFNSMDAGHKAQLQAVIDKKINNHDIKGAVATLQGKWMYHAFNGSVDMQLLEAKKLSWKELCFLLKVPYTCFDPDTNFANTEWQQKNWVSNTIIPDSRQLDGEFNRTLLKAFGLEKSAFIGSDFSELPELQQDLGKMATALSTTWWFTPNEKRKMMNEEPIADEQMDEVWVPTGVTPISQMNDAAEMEKITQQMMNERGGDKGKGV